ncbi:MAG: DUF2127 domain-containing protein [Ferrimonas sp.]
MAVSRQGLKWVAMVEALKGVLALLVALGIHRLANENLAQLAHYWVQHLHLNPSGYYSKALMKTATEISAQSIGWVSLGALAYGAIRLLEAYGLWWQRAWSEWLALLSGAIYVPFEVIHLWRSPSLFSVGLLITNLLIVIYMALLLRQRQ